MAMKKMEVADRERKLFSNRNQYSNEKSMEGGNRWKVDIKKRQKEMKRANSKRGGVSRHRM
jgi:uncharacterized protein (DUF2249 family)